MTRLALVFAVLALASCGATENRDYARATAEAFGSLLGGSEAPAGPAPEPTRAQLDAVPYSLRAVYLGPEETTPTYIAPVADNDGYISYLTLDKRGLTFRGAALTGTHGIGYDLVGLAMAENDPLILQRPITKWPPTVQRVYRLRDGAANIYGRAVTCVVERAGQGELVIREVRHQVDAVRERCGNVDFDFTNYHWIDRVTGYVWKSIQWTGPKTPRLTVEIVKPYVPAR